MIRNLRSLKTILANQGYLFGLPNSMLSTAAIHLTKDKNVADIDFGKMWEADSNTSYNFSQSSSVTSNNFTQSSSVSVHDVDGLPLAPVDVNPWLEEEAVKEGMLEDEPIDIDIEAEREESSEKKKNPDYPPIPEKRAGEYQFKGIQIKLPPNMLSNATYRYRMDKDDQDMADDIRICKFDK